MKTSLSPLRQYKETQRRTQKTYIMRITDRLVSITPVGDFVDACRVLQRYSVANVGELAIFKDQEVVLLSREEN